VLTKRMFQKQQIPVKGLAAGGIIQWCGDVYIRDRQHGQDQPFGVRDGLRVYLIPRSKAYKIQYGILRKRVCADIRCTVYQ
jgi:hypothetical protein